MKKAISKRKLDPKATPNPAEAQAATHAAVTVRISTHCGQFGNAKPSIDEAKSAAILALSTPGAK